MNKFIEYIKNYTAGKNICILGFGREGKSTYKILAQYCLPKKIAIADLNPVDRDKNSIPQTVEIITGEDYQEFLDSFDIVFKSPGIVLKKSPSELKCAVSCETQIFFEVFRDQIVGITGTKGKSTVTSLIYHILQNSGRNCRIAGNIGIPVFDIAENMTTDTTVVCELSCHQLEYMSVSPKTAVFLNLYEEHLDHYGTLDNYFNAKKNIYLHQQNGDILYCNSEIIPHNINAEIISVSLNDASAELTADDGEIFLNNTLVYTIPLDKIKLLGVHNHYNIAIAYGVCRKLGITNDEFTEALCSFTPLAHRLEYVDTVNGVRYYDDSISTACATAVEAIKSVPNAGTILIGGMDRGIDYTPLVEFLMHSDVQVVCMEASGKRIYNMIKSADLSDISRIHYADHLCDAVRLAAEITPNGKSCILSPAAASYGIFKNFEERGDAFKAYVAKLKDNQNGVI